ncbi:MAG: heparinase II/III family protein [Acidobacteria bacterium]|nr:heparinase II/III family protein [Acidobacteriota bacterium]
MRALFLAVPLAAASLLAADDPLATLRTSHPRLMVSDADLERFRGVMAEDANARRLYGYIKSDAERLLTQSTVEYKLIGPRLLEQSRLCMSRVYRLAFTFRMEGDRRFLDRALLEMWAAANFKDWNPSHFLDTAEMTHAFAIGYDWLYNDLAEDQRAWLRRAIVKLGLDPALERYALNGKGDGWWAVSPFNWTLVVNGGIVAGALAVAEDEPERARRVAEYALKSAPLAMKSYAPDGGWAEGPGYWDYATRYAGVLMQSLNTALGSDFGLSEMPGFDRAGHFRIFTASPIGRSFNYADSSDGVGGSWPLMWLARRFGQPTYAWFELDKLTSASRTDPLDLACYPETSALPDLLPSFAFRGIDVAVLRTSWTDRNGIFLGIKGGDNAANHSHLDLGSFVLDMKGQRWAIDLGGDDYDLPDYFGGKRWTYYRLRTESHNTVLINGQNQDTAGRAPIVESDFSDPSQPYAAVDLKGAYPKLLAAHTRRVWIENGSKVVFIDSLRAASQPVEALWSMVTDAEVQLRGNEATLAKGGRTLTASVYSPAGAVFEVISTQPASAAENQNRGTRKLAVRLPGRVERADIVVTLE